MAIDYSKRPDRGSAPTPPPAPSGAPVSLSKVTLTKSAPSVSLTKQGSAGGVLRVNLQWNARPADAGSGGGGGFLAKMKAAAAGGQGGIDLDLGCLYEFTDGSKGVVQALGNSFAASDYSSGERIIWLDGDDRSGGTAGENLHVDLRHVQRIRRVLVFALIYEGVSNWAGADGIVTLFPQSGPPIEVRLDEHDSQARVCAIALLENAGTDVSVRREVRYIRGSQSTLDQAYGWGLDWSPGRK